MFPAYINSIKHYYRITYKYSLNKFGSWCWTSSFEFWYVLQIIFIFVTLLSDIDIHDVSGYTVGTQHLQNLSVSSAEMTHYLCNIKIFGTNCIIKKYRVPFFNYVLKDKIVLKYMDRPVRFKTLTLTEYSRYLQNKHSRNSFCYHIFYLHNIIQFAKQSNKHMSNIFDIDNFCQYSFFTKNDNKSFSNLYTLHMYRYSTCDTMLTIYTSFYSEKWNLSTFFH